MFLLLRIMKVDVVGCGSFETTAGLRTDSPAVDVDSHNIVCSWCAQAHVCIHAYDISPTDMFKGKKTIESSCIVLQKKELQATRFFLECFHRQYPRCRTRIVAKIEDHVQTAQFSLNRICPTLFTPRNQESLP